jgi:hypothetical protein
LGLENEAVVERILTERKKSAFRSTGFLADLIGNDAFVRLAPYLDVRSRYFHIQARAFAEGKSASIHLLARRGDDGAVEAVQSFF